MSIAYLIKYSIYSIEPLQSAVTSRWERKQQAQSAKTPTRSGPGSAGCKTPRTGGKGKQVGTPSQCDRFIPSRDSSQSLASLSNFKVADPENVNPSDGKQEYRNSLAQSLFSGDDLNSKILAFKKKAPKPEGFLNNLRVVYSQNQQSSEVSRVRKIASAPEKILDAPGNSFFIFWRLF